MNRRMTYSIKLAPKWTKGLEVPIMNLAVKGKYALVSGGRHGIGRSTALALAEEGCQGFMRNVLAS